MYSTRSAGIRPALRSVAAVLSLLALALNPITATAQPVGADLKPVARKPARVLDDVIVRVKPGADVDLLTRQLGVPGRKLRTGAKRDLRVLRVAPGQQKKVLEALRASGLVEYAEPDYELSALVEPNDFRFWDQSQWGLKNTGIYGGTPGADVDATVAWDTRTSAAGVIVAIVDTGIRTTHEDLRGNLWKNPGENGLDANGGNKATNGLDDDGNGYVDDANGINALLHNGNVEDDYGHGSHVAGIIGATANNGVGIAGVAWQVQLMPLKFLNSEGHGSISGAIECMEYAREHGARIINASWGSYAFASAALQDCLANLAQEGILFVAACGNSGGDNDVNKLYPASYDFGNILAVAASNRTDNKPPYSNWGATTVDLAAPGSPVFSAWNRSDSDYLYLEGTSMAAPHVSGAAALLWAERPGMTVQQLVNCILANVDPLPDFTGKTVSGGRLNIAKAFAHLPGQPPPPPPPGTRSDVIWVDDAIPAGAWTSTSGGDAWNWITSGPAPFSGLKAHQSALVAGYHDHTFQQASAKMTVATGDVLFTYIYVDPANPPREIMISWFDGSWEHRAFWGENLIPYGTYNTASLRPRGALPAAGGWVRLEVPANLVGLEGSAVSAMSYTLYNGRATWDASGRNTEAP